MDNVLRTPGHPGSGDDELADALYRQYRRAVVRFCRRRLPNPADAEDAAHDTFVRAIQALPRLDPDVPVWPWLATIAANVCADAQRRGRRWERAAPLACPEPVDIDEHVAARVRTGLVIDALDSLAPRQRVPVYLKDLVGWSYQEIARLQGTSVGGVRSMLLRSRRALRTRVEALARARGQWPLPAMTPGTLGPRSWRAWRHHALRPRAWSTGVEPTAWANVLAFSSQLVLLAAAAAAAWLPPGTSETPSATSPPPSSATTAPPQARHVTLAVEAQPAAARVTTSPLDDPPPPPSEVLRLSTGAVLGDDGGGTDSRVTETPFGFTIRYTVNELGFDGALYVTCGFNRPGWGPPCYAVKNAVPDQGL